MSPSRSPSTGSRPSMTSRSRRAVAMALDRQAFIDILGEGQGDISAVMLPPPEGIWGIPLDMLRPLPGYALDVEKSREEGPRDHAASLGYGPDNPLKVKVSARNIAAYRDPATILIDQLKSIGIEGELETVETANWIPKLMRKDYTLAVSLSGSAVDDPDQIFYESYVCKSPRNYTGYCNPEVEALIDKQSAETDPEKRKRIVWDIERRMIEDRGAPGHLSLRAKPPAGSRRSRTSRRWSTAPTMAGAWKTSGSTSRVFALFR